MKYTRTPRCTRPLGGRPVPLLIVVALLLIAGGCQTSSPTSYDNNIGSETSDTFSGPTYLRGTVGSYGSFINNKPRYVGGYGMVVDLNATGSNEVPRWMRDWLINEMRRNNLGSVQFGTEAFGPERVMADLGSAVVAVEGLIPPGAARGSKFDLLVTMVDQTSTSLAGGRLFWPTQLSPTGLDKSLVYTETLAAGYGELFVNPIAPEDETGTEFLRQGVVVNGGTVTEAQSVQFVLNQPSYRVANLVAQRINSRFRQGPEDTLETAVAKNDGLIEINVPQRFSNQPGELLALIEHLYLDPSPQFVQPTADLLGRALVDSPEDRGRPISLAWKMLGPNATPVLRQYYNHEDARVQDASLQAGSWLQDPQVLVPLTRIATAGKPADRVRAARALAAMSRNANARKIVRDMLDDPDPDIRIGAYEALVLVGDRAVERLSVRGESDHKFFIDRVPSRHPMVYAFQGDEQSIVVFGGDIALHKQTFARLGDNLSLRTIAVDSIPVGLRDRHAGLSAFVPLHRCGALELIPSLTPVSDDPDAKLPPPDWRVEVGDKDGNSMMLNIRDAELQDAFGVNVLNVPNRGTPSDTPRAIAMVRVVQPAGKDENGKPTPAVGELLQLRDADASLPIALRYRKPGEREPKVYRVTPTVATLAYTLGFKQDNINTKTGPDLSFSEVVQALSAMSKQKQIPAPFLARVSPLAKRVSAAQRNNQTQSRPEITPEEFERLERGDEQIDGFPDSGQSGSDAPDAPEHDGVPDQGNTNRLPGVE